MGNMVVPTTSTSDNLEKTMQSSTNIRFDEDTDHELLHSSSSSTTSSSSSLKIHRPLDSTISTENHKVLQWRKGRGGADIKKSNLLLKKFAGRNAPSYSDDLVETTAREMKFDKLLITFVDSSISSWFF